MTPRQQLNATRELLLKERDGIAQLLAEADLCAARAYVHFELGQHPQAKSQLTKGCDLEYKALGDCEALGGLAQTLYPGEENI